MAVETAPKNAEITDRRWRVSDARLVDVDRELSEREHAVLGSIGQLRFLTTRHVTRLHFHDTTSSVTDVAARRRAQRCLARLADERLIEHLPRPIGGVRGGSAATVWRLASAGARLLDIGRDRREPALSRLAHVLEAAELVVQLHEHARCGAFAVRSIEAEPECWRPYQDAYGRHRLLKPDLRVSLVVANGIELHSWIEVDRATENHGRLTRKIGAYLVAWRHGAEQAQAGVFPAVFWLVPDQARATQIEQIWRETAGVPDGMFEAATLDQAINILARVP